MTPHEIGGGLEFALPLPNRAKTMMRHGIDITARHPTLAILKGKIEKGLRRTVSSETACAITASLPCFPFFKGEIERGLRLFPPRNESSSNRKKQPRLVPAIFIENAIPAGETPAPPERCCPSKAFGCYRVPHHLFPFQGKN
jgi:hypothetical protein